MLGSVCDCLAAESGHPVREVEDSRTVDIGGRPAVPIRLPMPPETHHLHRHLTPAHPRRADGYRSGRPLVELRHEPPLLLERQPGRDMDRAGYELPARPVGKSLAEQELIQLVGSFQVIADAGRAVQTIVPPRGGFWR